jgi:hypothetical protein
MCDFTTAQQINYVGEDGIFKQQEFTAMDFALVGKITIKAGTGGLTTPDQKVQNLGGLVAAGLLSQDEGKDAARPAFSKKLGLPPNPHEQRIERQITAFLKGPPSAEWAGQWTQYTKEKAAYDASQTLSRKSGTWSRLCSRKSPPRRRHKSHPSCITTCSRPLRPYTLRRRSMSPRKRRRR